ncbi:MAG: DUF1016 domain-containing protein [Zoogloeaceae bacterium]|nr:DUF1016 domain-containing protein [Zoogloeaceae bacterium]
MLELGSGFAFVGRQFRLEVNNDEFFIDLLFYHTRRMIEDADIPGKEEAP